MKSNLTLIPRLVAAVISLLVPKLIPVLGSPESVPDYMYDLDEDGIIGGENGIDFGSPFEPLTFSSFISHKTRDLKQEENFPRVKMHKNMTASNTTRDRDSEKDLSAVVAVGRLGQIEWQEMENSEESKEISNVSILESGERLDKFQSKLSRSGDFIFGSLLILFCKSELKNCFIKCFNFIFGGLANEKRTDFSV